MFSFIPWLFNFLMTLPEKCPFELITGILTDLYPYQYGIIGFFSLAISGGSFKTLLKPSFSKIYLS